MDFGTLLNYRQVLQFNFIHCFFFLDDEIKYNENAKEEVKQEYPTIQITNHQGNIMHMMYSVFLKGTLRFLIKE